MRRFRGAFIGILGLLMPWSAIDVWGHGDLHERIVKVSEEISVRPRQADLYLKRGELYRAHREWDEAQADYSRALALDPALGIVDLARGRMFLEAEWPRSAIIDLNRFLKRKPAHVAALTARARAFKMVKDGEAAVRDYSAAIAASKSPGPELYLERADAEASRGEKYFDEALAGLDEGIKRLGPLVTLQLSAVDLEIRSGEVDRGLKRLDLLASKSARKETWLARRGEILQNAGRDGEARVAYEGALIALGRLRPARARVPAMLELKARVESALKELDAKKPQ